MIALGGSKEFVSWATGISVVLEDDDSHKLRLNEARAYYLIRDEMAMEAVADLVVRGTEGPAADSVRQFVIHTRWERTYKMPESLPRKRWLEISGYRFPLPPQGPR